MIKNFFKIAWRNLAKNKAFSFINIIGLSIGLACFILIALYVTDELSYDQHHQKADRIYRIHSEIRMGGTDLNMAQTSDPMGATLKKDFPEVEEFVRFYTNQGAKLIKKGNEYISEDNIAYVDSTVFNVFTMPAIDGNTATALNEPNTVVISKTAALKYFGTTQAVGKMLETMDYGGTNYKVTAVMEDMPQNSHFRFDFMLSMDNVQYDWGSYTSHNFYTYLLLKPGAKLSSFEANFKKYINKYILPQAKQFMQINSMEEFEAAGNKLAYTLMPLKDIHLHSAKSAEIRANGNIQYVYIFSAVAIFILLIACINFMNLSTAKSANRAKEVGIRKVLGTGKNSLIGQFLTESVLMVFLALVLAVGIAALSIAYFNEISGKELSVSTLLQPGYLGFLAFLCLLVGILAGLYPAFFLSSFKPIAVLKGKINSGFKRSYLRSGLVVFQFFISMVLIVGTIVVYRQLNFIQNTKLGFNKEQVLVLTGTQSLGNNKEAFKEEVTKMPGVLSATYSGYLPVSSSSRSDNTFSSSPVMNSSNSLNMQIWRVDYDYMKTLGMQLVQGRNFSREYGTDSTAVVINETAARMMGITDPVGKKVYTNDDMGVPTGFNIIGVVKDFHFESLRQNISPVCFRLGNSDWSMAVKINSANIPGLLASVENKWKAMVPGYPVSFEFLDDSFDKMYFQEQRVGRIAFSFSILAILIACMGLFGLATYMAEQRTKEIGVRKVLGASVSTIVNMLSRDFARLVLIASVFAIPTAWFVMNRWLQDFAFRINIGWWVFLLAAILTLFIALATVAFQAVKAALANPVNSLRAE